MNAFVPSTKNSIKGYMDCVTVVDFKLKIVFVQIMPKKSIGSMVYVKDVLKNLLIVSVIMKQ